MARGDVDFSAHKPPALDAGRYRIVADQRLVTEAGAELAAFDHEVELHATGPRFTLTPDRIHSRFPAPGSRGDFGRVLPHIALRSPTLPWLRELQRPDERDPDDPVTYPWLALLVFDSADPAPAVVTGPLAELRASPRYAGGTEPEPGERDEELCQWIDIDAELFAAIAPTAGELPWLTHVRAQDGQELAVVVANRLPVAGEKRVTTCCLVSLELAGHVLPPVASRDVRLPVLETWSFSGAAHTETFGGLMAELTTERLRIADKHEALDHGYALLEHTLRQGAHSASWYRGPLLPSQASRSGPVQPGRESADELLRYDQATGMFDVSLAAAWQLGRLLALADSEHSVLIANWKAGEQRVRAQAGERKLVRDEFERDAAPSHAELQRQVARGLVERLVGE